MSTTEELRIMQAYPLDLKIKKTKQRIREFVGYFGEQDCAVSFSGGAYDTDGLWKPSKEGLGMAHCIDEINKIYGKDFIRY